MDPITLIVAALALGAAAGVQDTAATVVKDAYAGLKRLIRDKYAAATDSVEHLEKLPASQPRQDGVTEELGKTNAATDAALIEQAKALIQLVKTHDPETARTFGANLKGFEGGELQLGRVVARSDAGPVTGVDLESGKVPGKTTIGDVEVASGPSRPKAPTQ